MKGEKIYMKKIMKKYYELDEEVKDDLELLYIYQMLSSLFSEYENVKIYTFEDLDKLIHIIQKCMNVTDFSVDFIITNILEILNLQDVTINDLYDLELEDLLEVLFTSNEENEDCDDEKDETNEKYIDEEMQDEKRDKQEILAEFTYGDYYCIFCQNKDKYLLIITKGEYSGVIVLDSISEIFDGNLERKLSELKLHD